MTTRVDIEEIEATKSEKFLAVVLAAFLLIGTIWFYVQLDDWVPGGRDSTISAAEQKAQERQSTTAKTEEGALIDLENSRARADLAKNDFDIAVGKETGVAAAEAKYRQAADELRAAQYRADKARADSRKASQAVEQFERARQRESHAGHDWTVAGIRLGFVVGWLLASFRLVSNLRRKQSRFLPLGFAAAGAGVITALVYATDYITDYIDPLDLGPIVLSAAGVAATIGAFVGLQRWLARRIPGRRVRNGECPFCGHPVRGEAPHCEGCGREVIASCSSCGAPRHVGSAHCGHCGQS